MNFHPLTYKCRIYPKKRQVEQFEITLDACQFLFNSLLKQYKIDIQEKKITNKKNYLNEIMEDCIEKYDSIRKLDPSTRKDVLSNVLKSISHNKNPEHLKLRDDKVRVKSFLLNDQPEFELKDNVVLFGKYGKLKLHIGKTISYQKVISYRVIYQNKNWFMLVTIRSGEIKPFKKTNKKIGIDMGLNHLVILSNGEKIDPPDISQVLKDIDDFEVQLSAKQYNSNNYLQTVDEINRKHAHRKNIINDYYHKLSTRLVKEYDVIAMETLDIQEMKKDPRYSRGIFHANWHKLVRMIKYKCEFYGKTFIQVRKNFPSTQLCSNCGYRYKDITIDVRKWECPKCHTIHDRDVNAAKNILNEAMKTM